MPLDLFAGGDEVGHALRRGLDARHLLVMPHAHVPQVESGPQPALRPPHPVQSREGHLRPVGKARGQAGHGRLVGHVQPPMPRQRPHIDLAQAGLPQRRKHAVLCRGSHAGSMIALIIQVAALEHSRIPLGLSHAQQLEEEFVLAVKTPVRRVGDVVRQRGLARLYQSVRDADPGSDPGRIGDLFGRHAGRTAGHGQNAMAQRPVRRSQHDRRIHAARQRHHSRTQGPNAGVQGVGVNLQCNMIRAIARLHPCAPFRHPLCCA